MIIECMLFGAILLLLLLVFDKKARARKRERYDLRRIGRLEALGWRAGANTSRLRVMGRREW